MIDGVPSVGTAAALIIPALLWTGYLYYKDRHKPEPVVWVGLSLLLGIGSALICTLAYELQERWLSDVFIYDPSDPARFWIYAVVVIGGLEEFCKALPFVFVCLRFPTLDEPIDGIIFASCIGLGFALYENLYSLGMYAGLEFYGRALASPLVHTMFASIWGYGIGSAKVGGKPIWRPLVVSMAIAAVLHGLYDFIILALPPSFLPLSAGLILVVWMWRMVLIRRLHLEHPRQL